MIFNLEANSCRHLYLDIDSGCTRVFVDHKRVDFWPYNLVPF